MLLAIYRYRGFILGSVQREFQAKYQKSMLGATWLVLQPLSMILVYTLVFSQVMKARLPGDVGIFSYSIYLCIGIITWGLFAEIVGRGQNVFIENAGLLKKLNFPKICLPIIVILSALINFIIIFSLFVVFLIVTDNFHPISIIALIIPLVIQVLFATGLGISLGVINVFFRDVGQFVTVLLQFWFWFTPIVYVMSTLPKGAQSLLRFNPMAILVDNYQQIIIKQHMPNWSALWPVATIAVFLCILGMHLFRKHSADMVDEL
ncbi:ABC transporter permease [Yersinia frederiksenii]|uniref:ABC transporter permease n=1 Tax=Yersinia frederiksenii TaxID=29484 RepID=UPI0025AAFB59|nr:ABC transporter permease [Yersinia frederiksenii]MDN0121530.1 ABC transporter permease [Yersinia frederiksenii]